MSEKVVKIMRRIRSFVKRDSRATPGQVHAYDTLYANVGLNHQAGLLNYASVFPTRTQYYLEIGFGSGHSLLALAKNRPDLALIGVETYKPGVGSLLISANREQLDNLKIYHHDVVEVLADCIPPNSLDGVQVFFPDPWPKRRHHPRRLIQPEFVSLLVSKLKLQGTLHLATDWDDYAAQMMTVLSANPDLQNVIGDQQFAPRSPFRPVITKFEGRAIREGRVIRDLQFQRVK